jgi:hypothetical protein
LSGSVVRRRVAATLGAMLFAIPCVSMAQDPNLVDQGRFDITIGERGTGTETFAIRRQGEGYMAVGRMQLDREDEWLTSAEFGLRTDGTYSPVRFESRSLGRPMRSLVLTRTGTRLRITRSNDEGERMTELLATPNQVLLGPGIAQHYYFVVRRIEAVGDAGAGLVAILPEGGREQPVTVGSVSDVEVSLGEATRAARRYDLMVGDTQHVVWADASDGRILRVRIPARSWTSTRRMND